MKLLFEKAKDYEEASFKGLYNFINYIDKVKKSSGDATSPKIIGENEDVVRIMSIHKSKGLEFPIVFLSGTSKRFNIQDLNQSILIHQDLGFGPKYINYERKIEYSTLAREAIKIKTKNEILAEEMRILYVALTRAKEKLIITGVEKDLDKSMEWKKRSISPEEKISKTVIAKAKSYLDWLEMITLKCKSEILKVNVHSKNIEDSNYENDEVNIEENESKFSKDIDKILNWKYEYEDIVKLEGKTSVSKVSHNEEQNIEIKSKPKFMEIKKITSAEKGTLMHLVLQKLDFKKEYTESSIKELINSLVENEIIKKEEAEYIDVQKILNFTKSNLFKRISKAKFVYKESPFYINLPAEEFKQEKILVQGIIDIYFVEENENIVLVDYKTDYIKIGEEQKLVEKYKKQLELYKEAIEKSFNRKISEVYIYSVCLSKEINI